MIFDESAIVHVLVDVIAYMMVVNVDAS
jgi:hypothetical protein